MITLVTPSPSEGAREIARIITEMGEAARVLQPARLRPTNTRHLVVNWGVGIPRWGSEWVLNPRLTSNKMNQLLKLREAGVSCLEVSQNPPSEGQRGEWVPRRFSHREGRDIRELIGTEDVADYYTKYVPLKEEYRYHIFEGSSIRCGLKYPVHPHLSHPTIRSHGNGWRFQYSNLPSGRGPAREVARSAVDALGLDFGAVDIGIPRTGSPIVLEVNHAPGNEGGTTQKYAEAILKVYHRGR